MNPLQSWCGVMSHQDLSWLWFFRKYSWKWYKFIIPLQNYTCDIRRSWKKIVSRPILYPCISWETTSLDSPVVLSGYFLTVRLIRSPGRFDICNRNLYIHNHWYYKWKSNWCVVYELYTVYSLSADINIY